MLVHRRLGAAAALTTALTLAAAGSAAAHQRAQDGTTAEAQGAVFVQTDATTGNSIAVYDRAADGTLTAAGIYPTGGDGGQLGGSVVDHLASQDSLVYDAAAGELFAVNAGSDSVSVFAVNGDHLQLRQVIGSGGSFPASLTVHGSLVYVLNGAGGGQIQGFRLAGDGHLVAIPGSGRGLGLDPTATPQFVKTPGDIAFSPDGRQLIVTTKAATNAIDVYGIEPSGRPSATPTVNSEPAGTVPFGLAFTSPDQLNVVDAGTSSVASFRLAGDGTLEPISSVATGQIAACWLVADGSTLYSGNAGSATESVINTTATGLLSLAGAPVITDPGTVDAAVSPDGGYLYVQTGLNGVVDEFAVGAAGALTPLGSVTVPGAAGGEGIATS